MKGLGIQLYKEFLLEAPKTMNGTYIGLFGSLGPASGWQGMKESNRAWKLPFSVQGRDIHTNIHTYFFIYIYMYMYIYRYIIHMYMYTYICIYMKA